MRERKTVGAVHTIQFSKEIEEELVGKVKKPIYKINIEANRGNTAFICDKKTNRLY